MPKNTGDGKTAPATVVWGKSVEKGDFLKVPRTIVKLHRYHDGLSGLKPRHTLLLLNLASRKFQNKQIRAYWEELADDLGVSRETVRKWAYELINLGLLRTKQVRGRNKESDRVGYRNDRNIFDISPFVKVVEKAFAERERQKKARQDKDDT